jgi:hypothetical protein
MMSRWMCDNDYQRHPGLRWRTLLVHFFWHKPLLLLSRRLCCGLCQTPS